LYYDIRYFKVNDEEIFNSVSYSIAIIPTEESELYFDDRHIVCKDINDIVSPE